MYQLYYYPNNASLAPHFILHAIGAEYELVLVDRKSNSQKSSEYLELNPAGRIPTLVDASSVLFESTAICIHLCEKNPDKGLMPLIGDSARPLFYQWLAFLNNTLQTELMIYLYPHKHTTDANSIDSIREAQEERIAEALSILDNQLNDKKYLLGSKISACDYFFFMLALWSLKLKRTPLEYPNLRNYMRAMVRDSTVTAVCDFEKIDLEKIR